MNSIKQSTVKYRNSIVALSYYFFAFTLLRLGLA